MASSGRITVLSLLTVLLFVVIGRADAVFDTYESIVFHPFTMDWGNTDCIPRDEDGDGSDDVNNCDPVNLVFLELNVNQVIGALELQGWGTTIIGSSQSLHFATDDLVAQSEQLVKTDTDSIITRYHVRLWQVPGQTHTVGAVHGEIIFIHNINTHWEDAETFLAGDLCVSNFSCDESALLPAQWDIQGQDSEWRGWNSNGRLTVITASKDRPPPVSYLPLVSVAPAP